MLWLQVLGQLAPPAPSMRCVSRTVRLLLFGIKSTKHQHGWGKARETLVWAAPARMRTATMRAQALWAHAFLAGPPGEQAGFVGAVDGSPPTTRRVDRHALRAHMSVAAVRANFVSLHRP